MLSEDGLTSDKNTCQNIALPINKDIKIHQLIELLCLRTDLFFVGIMDFIYIYVQHNIFVHATEKFVKTISLRNANYAIFGEYSRRPT